MIMSVAHHTHGDVVVDLSEYGKLAFGAHLKIKSQPCGQKNGNNDAQRFEKNRNAEAEHIKFIAGNQYGQNGCDE